MNPVLKQREKRHEDAAGFHVNRAEEIKRIGTVLIEISEAGQLGRNRAQNIAANEKK